MEEIDRAHETQSLSTKELAEFSLRAASGLPHVPFFQTLLRSFRRQRSRSAMEMNRGYGGRLQDQQHHQLARLQGHNGGDKWRG